MNLFQAYTIAFAMITSPTYNEPLGPIETSINFQIISPVLKFISIDLEIMDRREQKYMFVKSDDLNTDLQLIRRRYRELEHAPRLSDCKRFPNRDIASANMQFNVLYRQCIEAQDILDYKNHEIYAEILRETFVLYYAWDFLRDATCDYYYVTVRRNYLQRLKTHIGSEAYFVGEMPPYIPIWRFKTIE